MKSYTEYLTFNLPTRVGFVNVTEQLQEAVRKSGIREGLLLCNAMHITASIFINDEESGLKGLCLDPLNPGILAGAHFS